ncbi:MAG: dihydromonapterin reductase [Legionellales bacterium]|nr:dihydromonapterin reductase [Legionellales bacterium]|tara:strand:- start:473 stop:1186 length:714 start_codon:yes stop_codon:yes gene_type:complete
MTTEPILITGVGKRLGQYLANNFLDRGISVIGTYRNETESLLQLKKKDATLLKCDLYNDADIESLIENVTRNCGGIRAIIHNASDWLSDSAELASLKIIKRMMQVHVNAPYLLNFGLAPLLMNTQHSHADIIHIGDYVSSCGSKKHVAYAASKAGQDNLTYSFSSKFAPKVKVNSLSPSLILFNHEDDDEYKKKTLKKSLMGREGGCAEFQSAIDYILNSEYITGRILPLDGGRHLK